MYADLWAPNGAGVASSNDMDVDNDVIPENEANEKVNMANAVDLSESEDEEEMEDIVDDFAPSDGMQDDVRNILILFSYISPGCSIANTTSRSLPDLCPP